MRFLRQRKQVLPSALTVVCRVLAAVFVGNFSNTAACFVTPFRLSTDGRFRPAFLIATFQSPVPGAVRSKVRNHLDSVLFGGTAKIYFAILCRFMLGRSTPNAVDAHADSVLRFSTLQERMPLNFLMRRMHSCGPHPCFYKMIQNQNRICIVKGIP